MEGDPPERLDVLAAIVEHIPAAVFAKDVEGRYILVNSTVEQQMGRPRAEILGKTDLELLSPAVAAAFVANDRRAIESGEPIETIATGALPDGPVTYRSVKFPLLDRTGAVGGVAGISVDLSDRRWTEALILAEIGSELGGSLDPDELGRVVARTVADRLRLDRCFIAELDPETRRLAIRHDYPREEAVGRSRPTAPPRPFEPWVLDALAAGQTIVIGASRAPEPAADEVDRIEGPTAFVAVPLQRDGRPAAVLAACARAPRTWSGGEVALIEGVAQRAWLAIENARLFRATTAALDERDATLAALAESEARFRQLTENIDNAVFWITDLPSRRVRYVSPSYEQIWGLSVERLLAEGTDWLTAVHPDDRARVERAFFEEAPHGGFDVEYRLVLPTGRVRWVHDRGYPLPAPIDGQTRITGVAEDITERREREERAAHLQALTAALAGAANPTAVAETILAHALPALGASAGFVSLAREAPAPSERPTFVLLAARGYSASRLVPGEPTPGDVPSALADSVAARAPIVFRTHAERLVRYPELCNRIEPLNTGAGVAYPLFVEGRPVGAIGVSFPTERDLRTEELDFLGTVGGLGAQALERARLLAAEQAAHAAAEDAQTRYRSLFDGAADAILVADIDGRLQDANPALRRLLGYERDELLRLRIADLMAGDLDQLAGEYARFLRDGTWQGEHLVRRADGAVIPVESHARIVTTPTGPVQWMALRDVTERKAVEQTQQGFLGSVSHDLKNPLSVIKGQAQYLRRRLRRGEPPDSARLDRGLATIEETVERAGELIQELMDVARLESGHALELQRQVVDLIPIARSAAETYGRLGDRHPIRVECDEPRLVGTFDGRRLERVIGNLLTNAVKYSPDGGEIVLRLGREEDEGGAWAVVAVRDRGVGIPDEDLAHVFERFRRGTNVRGIAGSGIGLAGVRQIVEQHGGTIGVESRQGFGSTFTVRLPLGLAVDRADGSTVTD
jgi:PAS domain S-box-containing protein